MVRKAICAVMVWVMAPILASGAEARGPAHPHVLFDAKMLPEMRRRAEGGPAGQAMQELARRVEGHLTAETLEPGRFSDPLVELAFAWQMTRQEACAERLSRAVARHRGMDRPTGRDFDWPLVYDLGYGALSKDDRAELHDAIIEAAERGQPVVENFARVNPGLRLSNQDVSKIIVAAYHAVAVVGEPGYQRRWLETAAEQFRRFFREGVGQDGAFAEHVGYWAYGFSLSECRGNLTAWAIDRKGYDLVTDTHLPALPEWMAYETAPSHAWCPHILPVEDAMLRPLSRYSRNMRLLRALMPENPAANLLLQWAQQGEQFGQSTPTYSLLAAIVLGAEPRSASPATFLDSARHFRDYNQVHFRTGWGPEDMSVFFAARWHHGHIHDDVGLFTLWSHGRFWASDPGAGIAETEAHNLVLVDGRGQPRRSAGGDIRQFVHSSLASLAEADSTRAWQRQLDGHYDWLTAPVVDTMMYARRVVTVLWPDTGLGVKPCLLVLDRMQKDTEERKYDWILNTWPDHQIGLRGNRATLSCPLDLRYFAGLDRVLDEADSKDHYIQLPVRVPAEGRYNVWAFGRGAKDWTGAAVDVWLDRQKVGYAPMDGPVWHWRKLSRTESNVLSAGQEVTVRLSQHDTGSAVRVRWIALSCDPDFDPVESKMHQGPKTVTVELDASPEIVGDWLGLVEPGLPVPELDVQFLIPEDVECRTDMYRAVSTKKSQAGQPARLQARLRGEYETAAATFLVALYPRESADRALVYRRAADGSGLPHQLVWPGAVDYLGVAGDDQPEADSGTDGQLALVRCPTEVEGPPGRGPGTAPALPGGTQYLMVNGNSLRFKGAELVSVDARPEAEEVVPLSRFGGYCTVVCDGQKLTVKAMTGPDAQYSIVRYAALRAYGPAVTRVEVNGQIVLFERDGDHVRFGVETEVFVPTRQRVAARVQREYRRLRGQEAKGGPGTPWR